MSNAQLAAYLDTRYASTAADEQPALRQLSANVRRYPLPIVCGMALRTLGASLAVCNDVQACFFLPLVWQGRGTGDGSFGPASSSNQLESVDLPLASQPLLKGSADAQPYDKLTAAQLKAKCHALGLLTNGTRTELHDRLIRAAQRGIAATATAQLDQQGRSTHAAATMEVSRGDPTIVKAKVALTSFLEPVTTAAAARPSSGSPAIVVLDKRERISSTHGAFVALFSGSPASSSLSAQTPAASPVISHTLPIGDIAFVARRTPVSTASVAGTSLGASDLSQYAYYPVLMERKTFRDLLTSVTSSHLAEQKQVMLLSPFRVLVLIVEGNSTDWMRLTAEEQRRITSSCQTASIVDGMHVLRTRSTAETVAVAKALAAKLPLLPASASLGLSRCSVTEVDAVTARLRSELQRNSIAVRMISCVAGVSTMFARELLMASFSAGSNDGPRDATGPRCSDHPLSSIAGLWAFSKWLGNQRVAKEHGGSSGAGEGNGAAFQALREALTDAVLDTVGRKQAFALLMHFLSCDVY